LKLLLQTELYEVYADSRMQLSSLQISKKCTKYKCFVRTASNF